MKQTYIFEYLNENDFRKKERTARKNNMLAYKKLTFEYYVEIRNGNFLGELVSFNLLGSKTAIGIIAPAFAKTGILSKGVRILYTLPPR